MRLLKSFLQPFMFMAVTLCLIFAGYVATAQEVVEMPVQDFLGQVLQTIEQFGGMKWMGQVAAVLAILISSMKVSFLNELVWQKLGEAKAWLAPALGVLYGVFSMWAGEGELTWAGVLAYFAAGAGAVVLHELLDTIKAVPGIGSVWVTIINIIKGVLGGPTQKKIG